MHTANINNNSNSAPHSENAALRTESPYQQRTTQRENPAQQLIKQSIEHLVKQLNEGKSEAFTAYLAAMARFHKYSFGNIMAIARQRPTATRVAGIRTWNEMGRYVTKGEKGIQILAPVIGNRRRKDDEKDATQEGKATPFLVGFRAVYVFDYAQTSGAELPEFDRTITGEVGGNCDRLIQFLAAQGIKLEFNEKIAPALGVSYGGRIAILPGQSKAEEFVTLVHETAHELLHQAERRGKTQLWTTATVRETEAEAVAFIVGHAVGLEMGRASSDYIQMYSGDAALLAESLGAVQQASAQILAALELEKADTEPLEAAA